jgi:hypothetical protein
MTERLTIHEAAAPKYDAQTSEQYAQSVLTPDRISLLGLGANQAEVVRLMLIAAVETGVSIALKDSINGLKQALAEGRS